MIAPVNHTYIFYIYDRYPNRYKKLNNKKYPLLVTHFYQNGLEGHLFLWRFGHSFIVPNFYVRLKSSWYSIGSCCNLCRYSFVDISFLLLPNFSRLELYLFIAIASISFSSISCLPNVDLR